MAADPVFRVHITVSRQVRGALKGGKSGRPTASLVEYSAAELRRHLERQFTPEMTWENHGIAWEVDHIVPILSFAFDENPDEAVKACWALTNLRPLGKAANRSKCGKRLTLL